MFGYVTVNPDALSPEEIARFRMYYCGLCRALSRRHGKTGTFTLSYDMTVLALTLTSLYEPETTMGEVRCARHPRAPQAYLANEMLDYAADMAVAMAYQKAMDDWRDERAVSSLSAAKAIEKRYARVKAQYPAKIGAIEQGLAAIHEIERSGIALIDPPANAFGALLGAVFAYRDDLWADALTRMGDGLGRFIYVMDAYDDVASDKRRGLYNPLIPICDEPDFDARCHDYLELMLADAANAFEELPLVEDIGLLRNVLYSGVWTKYEMKRHKREGGKRNG